jgi:hypothetical protein
LCFPFKVHAIYKTALASRASQTSSRAVPPNGVGAVSRHVPETQYKAASRKPNESLSLKEHQRRRREIIEPTLGGERMRSQKCGWRKEEIEPRSVGAAHQVVRFNSIMC